LRPGNLTFGVWRPRVTYLFTCAMQQTTGDGGSLKRYDWPITPTSVWRELRTIDCTKEGEG